MRPREHFIFQPLTLYEQSKIFILESPNNHKGGSTNECCRLLKIMMTLFSRGNFRPFIVVLNLILKLFDEFEAFEYLYFFLVFLNKSYNGL